MNLLTNATIHILRLLPQCAVPRRASVLKDSDYISILRFIRHGEKYDEVVQVRDFDHHHELIADAKIEKEYLSAEIDPDYDYLPFIELSIDYLRRMGDVEGAHKGHAALMKHLDKIKMKPYEDERDEAIKRMERMFK
jgi:hypothetical protein